MTDQDYKNFLMDYVEYAQLFGYNLNNEKSMQRAIEDGLLWKEFLNEMQETT